MKKFKIFLISIFLVIALSSYYTFALDNYTLMGKIIYLDAGQPRYLLTR